uniref:GP-PDE domain-containing protein n=1 Tax=Plectus sambesii TaxID=2011161 RepID=A0A914W3C0_9BILA
FDLEFTKDDVPILLHDADVDRTTNGTGRIADLTWAEVKKLNAAAKFKDGKAFPHTPIPTLDDTVDFCMKRNLKIFFDVKAPDRRAVKVLTGLYKKHAWLYENAAVCSFYPWLIYEVKRADNKIITAHTWRRWVVTYADCESTIPRRTGFFYHYLSLALDIFNVWSIHSWLPGFTGADLVLTNRLDISPNYVSDMRAKNLEIVVWTVNDPNEQLWMRHTLGIIYLTDRTSTTQLIKTTTHMQDVLVHS